LELANRRLIVIALLAVAGAQASLAGQSSRATAPQAALNRAADAILALKSTRFSLKREGKPAFLDEKLGLTFTASDCMYAAPDRVSCDVKITLKNGTIVQITRVWVPEGTFQSNPLTRQFAKLPPDTSFNGAVLFARTGIPEVLRTNVQNAQAVGREKVQNVDALHLKGEVIGAKLSPLMGAALDQDRLYPVDLWIDEPSGNALGLHVSEGAGDGWLIELSGTNEPVSIPTPQLPPPATARH
jgi:hypothetical protein